MRRTVTITALPLVGLLAAGCACERGIDIGGDADADAGDGSEGDADVHLDMEADPEIDTADGPDELPLTGCGNGIAEDEEECDRDDLRGLGCTDLGYEAGTLSCSDGCTLLETGCSGPDACGNGVLNAGETCDDGNGVDWDGCTGCAIGEVLVNTLMTRNQNSPDVAIADDGRFVVVWTDEEADGSGSGIFARLFDATGLPAGEPFMVNTITAGSQSGCQVDMNAGGGFAVVWGSNSPEGDSEDIVARVFDAYGEPLGDDIVVVSDDGIVTFSSSVARDPSGGFAVAWELWEPSSWIGDTTAFLRAFDADGDPIGSTHLVTEMDFYMTRPVISASRPSGYRVVWTGTAGLEQPGYVFMRSFDSSALPAGEALLLTTTEGTSDGEPVLDVRLDGSTVIVWRSTTGVGGTDYALRGAIVDAGGVPATPLFTAFDSTGTAQSPMSVAASGDGGFLATWCADGLDGYGWSVGARYFGEDGSPIDEGGAIGTLFRYDQRGGNADMAPDGRAVVVWSSVGIDMDGEGVVLLLLDADGTPREPGDWL